MDFIQSSNKQVDKFGVGKHGFSAGNPTAGVLATYFTNVWADNVQQELINVIEAAGLVANAGDQTQLTQAIRLLGVGRLLNVRQITATGVYTPTALTKSVLVMLQAAGGGGGGTTATGAGQVAAGLGGGGGAFAMSYLTTGFSGVTVTIGAPGTGVNGGPGNNAASSSFGALITCPGGSGGQVSGAQTPPTISGGGAASGMATGGNLVNMGGGAALPAAYIGTGAFYSGTGGRSFFGEGGGLVGTTTIGGNTGRGYGGGGSGSAAVASTAGTTGGGSGAPGACFIFEFGG